MTTLRKFLALLCCLLFGCKIVSMWLACWVHFSLLVAAVLLISLEAFILCSSTQQTHNTDLVWCLLPLLSPCRHLLSPFLASCCCSCTAFIIQLTVDVTKRPSTCRLIYGRRDVGEFKRSFTRADIGRLTDISGNLK